MNEQIAELRSEVKLYADSQNKSNSDLLTDLAAMLNCRIDELTKCVHKNHAFTEETFRQQHAMISKRATHDQLANDVRKAIKECDVNLRTLVAESIKSIRDQYKPVIAEIEEQLGFHKEDIEKLRTNAKAESDKVKQLFASLDKKAEVT